jgi:hypothetical protein
MEKDIWDIVKNFIQGTLTGESFWSITLKIVIGIGGMLLIYWVKARAPECRERWEFRNGDKMNNENQIR